MGNIDYIGQSGIKKTRSRQALLEILEQAKVPLSAAQIHSLYQDVDAGASISTTYRTLDIFNRKGIVTKTVQADDDNAQYALNRHEHKHYAVCKCCRKMLDIESCPMVDSLLRTAEGNFHITGHRLEVYGYCDDCYSKQEKQDR